MATTRSHEQAQRLELHPLIRNELLIWSTSAKAWDGNIFTIWYCIIKSFYCINSGNEIYFPFSPFFLIMELKLCLSRLNVKFFLMHFFSTKFMTVIIIRETYELERVLTNLLHQFVSRRRDTRHDNIILLFCVWNPSIGSAGAAQHNLWPKAKFLLEA